MEHVSSEVPEGLDKGMRAGTVSLGFKESEVFNPVGGFGRRKRGNSAFESKKKV